MNRVLINAANLHVGGGVQVAASFLLELAGLLAKKVDRFKISFSVVCSDAVRRNLGASFAENLFDEFRILNIRGIRPVARDVKEYFRSFDICFTVFGPLYFQLPGVVHVCGFAQPWIAYPDNSVYARLPFVDRLKTRLKYSIQWLFFSRSDFFVVELEHVRTALVRKGVKKQRISVVPNCVSAFFFDPTTWRDVPSASFGEGAHGPVLGFLGRGYVHKNLDILCTVDHILREKYGFECRFLFTLDPEEMESLGFSNRRNFSSLGTIVAAQCPSFYRKLDALVFPSLLECFSATPIEAMAMRTPIFASDRPFVRDVCGDYVNYFNPLDAEDIARSIVVGFREHSVLVAKADQAYRYCKTLPKASDRARMYFELILEHLTSGNTEK